MRGYITDGQEKIRVNFIDPLTLALGGSAIASGITGLFGGKRSQTFELSPEAKAWLNRLLAEYPLEVQQAILQKAFGPQIAAEYRGLRETAAPLGSAGQVQGRLEKDQDVAQRLYQAALSSQQGIRSDIVGLLGRTGTATEKTPFAERLSSGFGGVANILAFLSALKEKPFMDLIDKGNKSGEFFGQEKRFSFI